MTHKGMGGKLGQEKDGENNEKEGITLKNSRCHRGRNKKVTKQDGNDSIDRLQKKHNEMLTSREAN